MKASSMTLKSDSAMRAWISDVMELTKARLTLMVLITTWAGFYLGSGRSIDYLKLFHALFGTGLIAAAAQSLNQLVERGLDGLMRRTQNRPLPAGRLHPDEVILFAFFATIFGLGYLAYFTNALTAFLGAATLGLYVFIYTPLKTRTTINTIIGAIPGALPPVMGWTAATGEFAPGAAVLFAILFLWQLPHFLAISWLYRNDYAAAGMKMLPVIDPEGGSTARQSVLYSAALLPIGLMPTFLHMAGFIYFWGALVLGAAYVAYSIRFQLQCTDVRARHLFLISIAYLPLLLGLMAFDRFAA